jgi:hypothetical protein
VLHDRQVVGDEHQREVVAGLEVVEQVEDLRLHRHVEGGHRLVADDQVGLHDQRPGDRDALALPARELVGPLVQGDVGVEAHRVEGLADLGLVLLAAAPPPDPQRLGQDVAHLPPRVQRRDRVLEDELEAGADLPQALARQAGQVLPVEAHPTRRGRRQLDDRLAGRRLAAARLADEAERLALADVEGHARDGVDLLAAGGELDDQVLHPEQRVGGGAEVGGAGAGHQFISVE